MGALLESLGTGASGLAGMLAGGGSQPQAPMADPYGAAAQLGGMTQTNPQFAQQQQALQRQLQEQREQMRHLAMLKAGLGIASARTPTGFPAPLGQALATGVEPYENYLTQARGLSKEMLEAQALGQKLKTGQYGLESQEALMAKYGVSEVDMAKLLRASGNAQLQAQELLGLAQRYPDKAARLEFLASHIAKTGVELTPEQLMKEAFGIPLTDYQRMFAPLRERLMTSTANLNEKLASGKIVTGPGSPLDIMARVKPTLDKTMETLTGKAADFRYKDELRFRVPGGVSTLRTWLESQIKSREAGYPNEFPAPGDPTYDAIGTDPVQLEVTNPATGASQVVWVKKLGGWIVPAAPPKAKTP